MDGMYDILENSKQLLEHCHQLFALADDTDRFTIYDWLKKMESSHAAALNSMHASEATTNPAIRHIIVNTIQGKLTVATLRSEYEKLGFPLLKGLVQHKDKLLSGSLTGEAYKIGARVAYAADVLGFDSTIIWKFVDKPWLFSSEDREQLADVMGQISEKADTFDHPFTTLGHGVLVDISYAFSELQRILITFQKLHTKMQRYIKKLITTANLISSFEVSDLAGHNTFVDEFGRQHNSDVKDWRLERDHYFRKMQRAYGALHSLHYKSQITIEWIRDQIDVDDCITFFNSLPNPIEKRLELFQLFNKLDGTSGGRNRKINDDVQYLYRLLHEQNDIPEQLRKWEELFNFGHVISTGKGDDCEDKPEQQSCNQDPEDYARSCLGGSFLTSYKKEQAIKIREILKNIGHPMRREAIAEKLNYENGHGGVNSLFARLSASKFLISNMLINKHRGYGLPEWRDKNENKDPGRH